MQKEIAGGSNCCHEKLVMKCSTIESLDNAVGAGEMDVFLFTTVFLFTCLYVSHAGLRQREAAEARREIFEAAEAEEEAFS